MNPQTLLPPLTQTERTPVLAFTLCFLAYALGGTVSTLLSVYLPMVLRDLGAEGTAGAVLNAAFLYGWVLGGLGSGLLADRFGRVRVLALGATLMGAFTLGAMGATSWPVLAALRFGAGAGVGGVLVVTTTYLAELTPARTRPVWLGLLAMGFPVGIVGAGSLIFVFERWRDAFSLGLIPLLLGGAVLATLREPADWRTARTPDSARFPVLFSPTYRLAVLRGSLVFGAVLIGLWAVFSWTPSWVQSLFTDPAEAARPRGLTMMLFGLGGIVGGAASGFLVRAFGLRRTLLGTFATCFVLTGLLFGTNAAFTPLVYLETAGLALAFGVSQGALSTFVPMLFPTALRATATGFCFNVGRVLTATGVFFVGSLVAVFGGLGNALLLFSLTFVVALAVSWFGPKSV